MHLILTIVGAIGLMWSCPKHAPWLIGLGLAASFLAYGLGLEYWPRSSIVAVAWISYVAGWRSYATIPLEET